jgi:hypothetical protein
VRLRFVYNLGLSALSLLASARAAAQEPAPPSAPPPSATPPPIPPPAEDELALFEETATAEAPEQEVTKRSVDAETIRRLPGGRGDALRGIEVLPGVARTTLDNADPILRGAAGHESETLLNGTPVPFLYHFGGLTSFLSSRLVERLELYPGNFPVRYGRVAGGVLDVRVKDPQSDRLRAAVDLSLIDSAGFVEAPLGDSTNVALAVRRSNIDFFFDTFVPDDVYSVVAAPVYYDYQGLVVHRFSDATRLRVMGYGSQDTLKLLFSEPPDEDPAIAGNVQGKLAFHRLALELETEPSATSQLRLSATLGWLDLVQRIGSLEQVLSGPEVFARAEGSFELASNLRASVGGDFSSLFASGRYRGPYPGQLEGEPRDRDPLGTARSISDEIDAYGVIQPALYADLGYRPLPELLITPGARLDYFHQLRHWTFDPRLALRYELTPTTALKGGAGYFTQAPEFWQSLASVGNPAVDPYRALQFSLGVEQGTAESAKVGLEGFYKRLEHYVVATENREAPHYRNTGQGRMYGAELSAQARFAGDGLFYLAYTLSKSERRSSVDEPFRLFDADQTHLLSLVTSKGLGAGWEIGARFRLASGNPSTPITGAVYDARSGLYIPRYGAVNSERTPLFHQLDLRVEKAWHPGPLTLALYLDIQNVYNAQHREDVRYAYDYSASEGVTGLPFFPNLGFRGEL